MLSFSVFIISVEQTTVNGRIIIYTYSTRVVWPLHRFWKRKRRVENSKTCNGARLICGGNCVDNRDLKKKSRPLLPLSSGLLHKYIHIVLVWYDIILCTYIHFIVARINKCFLFAYSIHLYICGNVFNITYFFVLRGY